MHKNTLRFFGAVAVAILLSSCSATAPAKTSAPTNEPAASAPAPTAIRNPNGDPVAC